MKAQLSPLLVPFREVRHDAPDDCLHYEPVAVRGQEMDWTIPAHRHQNLHQFQLLERGRISGEIDGQAFEAQAPVLLMLAPDAVHGFRYSRDSVGHQITLPGGTLAQLLGQAELARAELGTSFVIDGPAAQEAADDAAALFAGIAREFRGALLGRVQSLLALACLVAVLFVRRRTESMATPQAAGARDALVQRYRGLLEQHYAAQQPLSFYAKALRVTPDHLSRTCRRVTGQSALDLLHERLMLEARRLLTYTAAPVLEVGRQLGYEDPAYFSKFFRRFSGVSPSEYRRLIALGVQSGVEHQH